MATSGHQKPPTSIVGTAPVVSVAVHGQNRIKKRCAQNDAEECLPTITQTRLIALKGIRMLEKISISFQRLGGGDVLYAFEQQNIVPI
jgi:hypothetical protein